MFNPPASKPPLNVREPGLGDFHVLADDILVEIIVLYVPLKDLMTLSSTSKLFRLLLVTDTIFKLILLKKTTTGIKFNKSWKQTLQDHCVKAGTHLEYKWFENDLKYYSLFIELREQLCTVNLQKYWPETSPLKQVQCFQQGEMTFERLLQYELHSEPFMVRAGLDTSWISNSAWQHETLQTYAKNCQVLVGNSHGDKKHLKMTMQGYLDYFWNQRDDNPLYLFDKDFGTHMPFLLKGCKIPDFVKEDYLSLLENRPAYRWIVMGPMRTGASWHIDPPGTTAWNTLIGGRKLWALYPPGREPPKSDLSTLLWYLTVYPKLGVLERPLEILQYPGDTIVVPEGWWHCILNLEIVNTAVTQNFASRINIKSYIEDIKLKPAKFEAAVKAFAAVPVLREIIENCQTKKVNPSLQELLPTAINILQIAAPGHEFSVSEEDFTLSETDNQVVYHEESNLFIKLIVPAKEQKFKMELQALNLAKNSLAGIVPEVVAYGTIGEYHFIASKGCHLLMDDYNLSMFTLEREQRSLINFDYLTQWTASILSILHQTRGERTDAMEFSNNMEYLCNNAQQKHRKFKYFPESLVEGIPEFLMKFKVSDRDLVSGILHGDFTMGNILGHISPAANEYESEFRSSNLIDFGDSFIGSIDPLYDIATAFVDLFRCDCNLLAKFLAEYGKLFKYLSYEEFKHRILRYVILYPSECLSREFCKILFIMKGRWTESMDWLWVESQLFPAVDFRPSL